MDLIPIGDPAEPYRIFEQLSNSRPFRRLLALAAGNGGQTAVVTTTQDDADWSEEKDLLFGSLDSRVEPDLCRVDFLRSALTNPDDVGPALSADPDSYLGYAVLRPGPLKSVLHALVSPPDRQGDHFLTCGGTSSVPIPHLGGPDELPVYGSKFKEQDGMVSRCAHASLWIASRSMPTGTNAHEVSTKGIYDAIRNTPHPYGRRVPSNGLTSQEVWLALENEDYSVVSYDFDAMRAVRGPNWAGDHIIYRYVESGFPVIVVIRTDEEYHSLVILGHSFDSDPWWPQAQADYYPSLANRAQWLPSALWASQYVAHDDNYGPYLNLSRGSIRTRVTDAFVPLPADAKVHLVAEDAETRAAAILYSRLTGSLLTSSETRWKKHISARYEDKRFVLRTVLVRSTDFHREMLKPDCTYSDETKALIAAYPFPEWIWLVEVSAADIFGEQLKFGEILLDPRIPNAMHFGGHESLLAVHFLGAILLVKHDPLDMQAEAVGAEEPCPVLKRTSY